MPALDLPAPPGRLIVPTTLPEPTPDPTPTPVAQPPARPTAPPPASRQVEKPTPTPTPPPEPTPTATPGPVLQTTPNADELAKTANQQLASASRDLDKVNFQALSADARQQYQAARQYIDQAKEALRVKNYVFANQLAEKAAVLASLLVKGESSPPSAPTSS